MTTGRINQVASSSVAFSSGRQAEARPPASVVKTTTSSVAVCVFAYHRDPVKASVTRYTGRAYTDHWGSGTSRPALCRAGINRPKVTKGSVRFRTSSTFSLLSHALPVAKFMVRVHRTVRSSIGNIPVQQCVSGPYALSGLHEGNSRASQPGSHFIAVKKKSGAERKILHSGPQTYISLLVPLLCLVPIRLSQINPFPVYGKNLCSYVEVM